MLCVALRGIVSGKPLATRLATPWQRSGVTSIDRIITRQCHCAATMVAVDSDHMIASSRVTSPPLPNARV
jgi:hypothetical protein